MLTSLAQGKNNALTLTADLEDKKYEHIKEEEKDSVRTEVQLMIAKIEEIQTAINCHD